MYAGRTVAINHATNIDFDNKNIQMASISCISFILLRPCELGSTLGTHSGQSLMASTIGTPNLLSTCHKSIQDYSLMASTIGTPHLLSTCHKSIQDYSLIASNIGNPHLLWGVSLVLPMSELFNKSSLDSILIWPFDQTIFCSVYMYYIMVASHHYVLVKYVAK